MSEKKTAEAPFDALSRKDFEQKMERVAALIGELEKELEGFHSHTDEDRLHSEGKLREGESAVLGVLIDVAEKRPAMFAPLADKDEGHDPKQLETGLLRDRLAKRDACAEAATRLEPVLTRLRDSALRLGELTRPVLLAGYRIAKPVAEHDNELRVMLAPVINFYARSKAAKQKQKQTP